MLGIQPLMEHYVEEESSADAASLEKRGTDPLIYTSFARQVIRHDHE